MCAYLFRLTHILLSKLRVIFIHNADIARHDSNSTAKLTGKVM